MIQSDLEHEVMLLLRRYLPADAFYRIRWKVYEGIDTLEIVVIDEKLPDPENLSNDYRELLNALDGLSSQAQSPIILGWL